MTLLHWELWAIGGLLLAIGEVFAGGMVLFPLGVSALVVSLVLGLGDAGVLGPPLAITDWRALLLVYSLLAVASVFVIRWAFRKSEKTRDVNDY